MLSKKNKNYKVIGLMSGTSLDGLDICAVNFIYKSEKWSFEITNAETIKYSDKLKDKFRKSTAMSPLDLLKFDKQLGELFGRLTKQFIVSNALEIDFIASHGHTIFHQPDDGITLQIGSGQIISNIVKLPTVYDFRSKDVSLGGQGAPLVPIGDKLLFSQFDACINFGGIANISYEQNNERIAYDICPFNMGLNFLSNQLGLDFDESGELAKNGSLIIELLEKLNKLEFYKLSHPKSLGIEWFNLHCLPLISDEDYSVKDRLHTFSHHIAIQLSKTISLIDGQEILITGGGVYNTFIIDLLKSLTNKTIVIPKAKIIDFKEALIFAFLSVLKVDDQVNVLKSVTGANKDSISGIIVFP